MKELGHTQFMALGLRRALGPAYERERGCIRVRWAGAMGSREARLRSQDLPVSRGDENPIASPVRDYLPSKHDIVREGLTR